jgi:hypothetical protein
MPLMRDCGFFKHEFYWVKAFAFMRVGYECINCGKRILKLGVEPHIDEVREARAWAAEAGKEQAE